ncbi:MAG: lysophospholipid acyltransferase family protein [Cellvibrionaceae bacterium]
MSSNPFRLPLKPRSLAATIEKLLSLESLARFYDRRPQGALAQNETVASRFLNHTLTSLDASIEVVNPQALEKIPAQGPTVFVANHPFGGLEGVAMTRELLAVRPDLKVLTNELLSLIPEFKDIFIGVDVLSDNAASKNLHGMRRVLKHLRSGGAILIFPAGMVSAIDTSDFRVRDRQWNPVVAKLMRQFSAVCVPFYVHGRNSSAFYLAGLIHPRLRTAMLARELSNKSGKSVRLTVGEPIEWEDVELLGDERCITDYFRTATDLLEKRTPDKKRELNNERSDEGNSEIDSEADRLLKFEKNDSSHLNDNLQKIEPYCLVKYREFEVYCAPYSEIPDIMSEIAIARERTFRAAGEGTGKAFDSDRFDPHYFHLFIWDRVKRRIAGGYRIGKVDQIVKRFGVDGLYSRTLYKFDEQYVRKIEGALEMGRSFVTPEYQKHPRALDLLWKGIGSWIVKNPGYHTLFGCVSISRDHSDHAREFLNETLMESFRAEQTMLTDVRPVAPLRIKNRVWSRELLSSLTNIAVINKLLGQCDPGKSIPVLLRQYLALNGRFVGFSVNRSFNDSLDGLILVDLRKAPKRYLQRYLGKEGSMEFSNRWRISEFSESSHAA